MATSSPVPRSLARILVLPWALAALACAPEPWSSAVVVESLDPPPAAGAMAPNLSSAPSGPVLSWLEPLDGDAPGHRLVVSSLGSDGRWRQPSEVARSDDFFANWADLPGAVSLPDGAWAAHWLRKLGGGTYAYGVRWAHAEGATDAWADAGWLHDDTSPQEHGFVSWAGARAFWLDGRAMGDGGAMQLRTGLPTPAGPALSQVLDDRVCECCATDAAVTDAGAVVVYRDRSEDEVRDVWIVRRQGDGWSSPAPVHRDGWRIFGCPVNGPAVAARSRRLAVAWFTGAGDRPRVQVAFSDDAGATFTAPQVVDDGGSTGEVPLGRVDVELGDDGQARVLWLAGAGDDAEVRLARVSDGGEVSARTLATTSAGRGSGVPRLARHRRDLLAVWVEDGRPSRLRGVRVVGGA